METSRGDAAATTWIFSGDASRLRRAYSVETSRGYDADVQWRRVARLRYDVTQWAYSRLEPGVVAERLVYNGDRPADDVKCFSFHGRTALVQHVTNRFDAATGRPKSAAKRDTFYDPSGRARGVTVDGQPALRRGSSRLLSAARVRKAAAACDAIATGLDMARVDLFDTGDAFLLGEVTMYRRPAYESKRAAAPPRLGYSAEMRRRRGLAIPRRTRRGDAAAATWIFRGDEHRAAGTPSAASTSSGRGASTPSSARRGAAARTSDD